MTELEADQLYAQVKQMPARQLLLLWKWLLMEWAQKMEEKG